MIFKHSTRVFTTVAAILLSASAVSAQTFDSSVADEEEPSNLALTLQGAEEYALAHNTDIMNAGIEIQKAEAQKWQAIASMLPQISATLDYGNYFGYRMDLGQMSIAMPPYGSLGITSALAFSGAQIVSVKMAEISRKMSDITLYKTRREITDQVKTVYVSALMLQKTLGLLGENYNSMKKLHEMSESSVAVGVTEQTSADQLLVQVNTMADNISSAERSLEVVFNTMRLLLGVNEKTEITLLQSIENLVDVEAIKSLLDERFDITRNYDYQLLKQATDISKKQMRLNAWNNGPTLSIYHQYSGKKYFSDEMTMNMTPPNMIGISLKIPIFTSLRNTMAYKSSKLAYRQQLNSQKQAETALRLQYRQLVYNLNSTLERYNTQKLNISVAQRVFDNTARKYEFGVASSMDVTQAMTSLLSAESNYLQSLQEMTSAQISLEQLLNK